MSRLLPMPGDVFRKIDGVVAEVDVVLERVDDTLVAVDTKLGSVDHTLAEVTEVLTGVKALLEDLRDRLSVLDAVPGLIDTVGEIHRMVTDLSASGGSGRTASGAPAKKSAKKTGPRRQP